jgi:sortase A
MSFFTWVRNIGALMLLFVAWQLWGTSIAQHHAQGQLQSSFQAAVRAHHAAPASGTTNPALIAADKVVPGPAEGAAVAQLEVPAAGIDQFVVMGTAESDLAKGPGHYIGTAMPGQAGNIAIAGHRTTNGAPFNRLGSLVVGDQIHLVTLTGEHLTYVVSQAPYAVSPSDVAVLNNFGDNRITLTTCNPEFSASQRLIVVGKLSESGSPVAAPTSEPSTYHIVDPATASWNWGLLPVVLLEVLLLAVLGLTNQRLKRWYGGAGRWIILVPVWTAGLYLLFESLTAFLPPTL